MRTCEIEGCENSHQARGWCNKHYIRWTRNGDPLITRKRGYERKKEVTYVTRHQRLYYDYGKASDHDCFLGFHKADEWAFVKDWCPEDELIETLWKDQRGKERLIYYSMNDAHYITMCSRHHLMLDKGSFA